MASLNDKKVRMFINSRNRDSTSASVSDFTIRLPFALTKIKKISVASCEIPISYYATSSSSLISWTMQGTGTTYTASIASGTYSIGDFVTALQTAMNAQLAGFTITNSGTTMKITITHASAFRINSATTLSAEIGFAGTTSSYATSWTSDNVVNVSGTNHIFILSTQLARQRRETYTDNTLNSNIFFKIAITDSFSQVTHYKPDATGISDSFYNSLDLSVIDFKLVDEQLNAVNLNGINWMIELDITTDGY